MTARKADHPALAGKRRAHLPHPATVAQRRTQQVMQRQVHWAHQRVHAAHPAAHPPFGAVQRHPALPPTQHGLLQRMQSSHGNDAQDSDDLAELHKYLVVEVNQDNVLLFAAEDTPQIVHDEGVCGALTAGFIALILMPADGEETDHDDIRQYYADKHEMRRIVSVQVGFRERVLVDIDAGYAYLLGEFLLKKLAEASQLASAMLQDSGSAILITFMFEDQQNNGQISGHGLACVRVGDRVFAFDPNEGVFDIPAAGWLLWIRQNLLSAYGKITLMTVYNVARK